jgi:hypothetical protein
MKQYLMLKASGLALAMALGFAAMPNFAADGTYSDTYSTPRDTTQDSDVQQQQAPSDVTPPPPSVIDEGSTQAQPRGPRGPIRSDEMASDSYRSERSRADNKGYMGYLDWQHENTNTP